MTSSGLCLAHGRPCSLKMAKRHVAGTPCVPWSKRGINLGLKDVNTLYLLAWIGLRLQLQEPDVTQERLCQNEAAKVFHCEELQMPDEPNVFILTVRLLDVGWQCSSQCSIANQPFAVCKPKLCSGFRASVRPSARSEMSAAPTSPCLTDSSPTCTTWRCRSWSHPCWDGQSREAGSSCVCAIALRWGGAPQR